MVSRGASGHSRMVISGAGARPLSGAVMYLSLSQCRTGEQTPRSVPYDLPNLAWMDLT